MRVLLSSVLISILLSVQALAQSPANPTSQAEQLPSATTAESRDERQEGSVDTLKHSLAVGERQLTAVLSALGERDWVALLLTLFNGLLALFAFRLSKSLSRLIDVSREQGGELKQAVAVAKEVAGVAKKSADVAALQARALIGVELPRLELGSIHLVCADQSVRQALKAPAIEISFTNYGRTTAFVLERCVEVRLNQALPPEPAYNAIEALQIIEAVESGNAVSAGAHRRVADLTETQVQMLLAGLNSVWVYGFIKFRDFLGMEHKKGFCLRWVPPPREASTGGAFVQEDPGSYVYQTDHWPQTPAEPARPRSPELHAGPRLAPAAE